ncbi:MAG: class I SAM-dependent methyltransferase [Candidatus Nanopelagicales bacterium]
MVNRQMDGSDWDKRYSTADMVWSIEPNVFVSELTAGLPAGTALDLAAGEGRNALWLAARGWKVTAVDFSAAGLDRAERLAQARLGPDTPRFTTICQDVTDYRPQPRSFDLVVIAYLQVPTETRTIAMRTAGAALREGGTLVVVAHDSVNLVNGFGGPQDPDVLYTAADIVSDLDGLGLVVDRAEAVERHIEISEGTRTAIDALVVARRPD